MFSSIMFIFRTHFYKAELRSSGYCFEALAGGLAGGWLQVCRFRERRATPDDQKLQE